MMVCSEGNIQGRYKKKMMMIILDYNLSSKESCRRVPEGVQAHTRVDLCVVDRECGAETKSYIIYPKAT